MPETGQLIAWLFIGTMAGAAARSVMRQELGLAETVLVGLVGAFLGGYLLDALDVEMPDVISTTFTLGDLITAFFGAVLLILLANLILRKRRK